VHQQPAPEAYPPYQAPPPVAEPPRPAWNGKTNGFAIACLSLSLFGCVGPASIVFGVLALRQTRRNGDRRGRFYAIAGLTICGLWLGAIAVAVVVNLARGDDRDASGAVRGERSISLDELRAGDCLKDLMDETGDYVDVVPCTTAHSSEVVARFDLPESAWPGDEKIKSSGQVGCDELFQKYAGTKPDSSYVVFASPPDKLEWPENRNVLCLAHYPGKPATGSLRR
jgi:hypothetical protein